MRGLRSASEARTENVPQPEISLRHGPEQKSHGRGDGPLQLVQDAFSRLDEMRHSAQIQVEQEQDSQEHDEDSYQHDNQARSENAC